jgi:chitinase
MNSSRPLFTFFAAILSLGVVGSTAAPPNYIVTKLGSLGDDFVLTVPYAINNGGRVVGQSNLEEGTPHVFLSFRGMIEDLGTLGGRRAVAHAINASGVIVGWSELPSGDYHPFRYRRGQMQDLGFSGSAEAINNRGEIVGQAASGRAFLFQDESMLDLGTLGGLYSGALSDINESGTIVGVTTLLPNGPWHAFVYEAGVMHDLGTLGGPESGASDINNQGLIVGFAQLPNGARHAVLYEDGRIQDLGSLFGHVIPSPRLDVSTAVAINDQGVIVGYSTTPQQSQHAFVYTDGVMYDLHHFIAAAEPEAYRIGFSFANAINERGQIAVYAEVHFMRLGRAVTEIRGYVLSPGHGGE